MYGAQYAAVVSVSKAGWEGGGGGIGGEYGI
jgi:hypothetical protein